MGNKFVSPSAVGDRGNKGGSAEKAGGKYVSPASPSSSKKETSGHGA